MKKYLSFLLTAAVACTLICGCDGGKKEEKQTKKEFTIMTDFEIAKSQSKINNKPILLIFSGSDWCRWCVKLDKEVFSTPEFQKWAADNVITVIADFPATKQLPPQLTAQNEQLKNTYQITGFPTVLLLDADGSIIARTGYQHGGAANYIPHLENLLKNSPADKNR